MTYRDVTKSGAGSVFCDRFGSSASRFIFDVTDSKLERLKVCVSSLLYFRRYGQDFILFVLHDLWEPIRKGDGILIIQFLQTHPPNKPRFVELPFYSLSIPEIVFI
ncbi:hypothetical protein MTP99_015578 [Tenebrio molitor]|jgi:hypothetical protein|nr:hypothetical protein MTP99_015578 [Tenebrio molitor]